MSSFLFCILVTYKIYDLQVFSPKFASIFSFDSVVFSGLPFHFADKFLCFAEVFYFYVVPLIYFCFWFWANIVIHVFVFALLLLTHFCDSHFCFFKHSICVYNYVFVNCNI